MSNVVVVPVFTTTLAKEILKQEPHATPITGAIKELGEFLQKLNASWRQCRLARNI
jgi:hypothetical protein